MNHTSQALIAARRTRGKNHHPLRGVGIQRGNPPKCFVCRKRIGAQQAWTKYTSPAEPEGGRYSFLVHEGCTLKTKVL